MHGNPEGLLEELPGWSFMNPAGARQYRWLRWTPLESDQGGEEYQNGQVDPGRGGFQGMGRTGVGWGGCGGGKAGSICHFAFSLCSVWRSQDTEMLGKTARKVLLSHPFLRARVPHMLVETGT